MGCSDLRDRVLPVWRSRSVSFSLCGFLTLLAAVVLAGLPAEAQTDPATTKPYASINRDAVYYSGPGRGSSYDLKGNYVVIGMILPLRGSHEAEGKALLQAAQLALDEEIVQSLPDGRGLTLAVRDESGSWGQASSEMVRLILQDEAVALITSPDGNIAHQAEQIANKIGVPILTLASDATTTQINLPWIFRLGPSDADEARAFAEHIYRQRGCRKVLLLAQVDHDGRVGSEQFEKAARQLHAPPPGRLEISSASADVESAMAQVKARDPEAVVLWTDHDLAAELLPLIRHGKPTMPVYLCRKAAEIAGMRVGEPSPARPAQGEGNDAEIWVAASPAKGAGSARQEFEKRFRDRTGTMPSAAAAEAYDAVHVVAAALRHAGANRARVRDVLAAGTSFQGATGAISFDSAGNERGDIVVVRLQGASFAGTSF